jgi:hypothetical protein
VPTTTYDLFISYSSSDRPWAQRAYEALRLEYPSINVFWDRVAIPAGGTWRTLLTDEVVNTKHLLILWSNAAQASIEVGPEIATFEAEVRRTPKLGLAERRYTDRTAPRWSRTIVLRGIISSSGRRENRRRGVLLQGAPTDTIGGRMPGKNDDAGEMSNHDVAQALARGIVQFRHGYVR